MSLRQNVPCANRTNSARFLSAVFTIAWFELSRHRTNTATNSGAHLQATDEHLGALPNVLLNLIILGFFYDRHKRLTVKLRKGPYKYSMFFF